MISSRLEFVQALQADFVTAFATPLSLTVEWPNAPFSAPALDGVGEVSYARFSVVWGDTQQADFGTPRRFRTAGVLFVSIFSELNLGERDALTLAEQIAAHYRAVTLAGATFRSPSIDTAVRDGSRWLTTVRCPFYADQTA